MKEQKEACVWRVRKKGVKAATATMVTKEDAILRRDVSCGAASPASVDFSIKPAFAK